MKHAFLTAEIKYKLSGQRDLWPSEFPPGWLGLRILPDASHCEPLRPDHVSGRIFGRIFGQAIGTAGSWRAEPSGPGVMGSMGFAGRRSRLMRATGSCRHSSGRSITSVAWRIARAVEWASTRVGPARWCDEGGRARQRVDAGSGMAGGMGSCACNG